MISRDRASLPRCFWQRVGVHSFGMYQWLWLEMLELCPVNARPSDASFAIVHRAHMADLDAVAPPRTNMFDNRILARGFDLLTSAEEEGIPWTSFSDSRGLCPSRLYHRIPPHMIVRAGIPPGFLGFRLIAKLPPDDAPSWRSQKRGVEEGKVDDVWAERALLGQSPESFSTTDAMATQIRKVCKYW